MHAHNLLQSVIACHICWTVEKTFSSLIACNMSLGDAIAGMQINSINFRLNDLLEQLCRCFDLSTTIWAFMKFQVFNDSYPEPRFCICSCLRTFKTNIRSLNVPTWLTKTFSEIFLIWDWVWHLASPRYSARRWVTFETGTNRKQVVYEKHWLAKRVSAILAEIDARVRWLDDFSFVEISRQKKLQDHLPMTKRAVGKRCDIMQMIKLIKRS